MGDSNKKRLNWWSATKGVRKNFRSTWFLWPVFAVLIIKLLSPFSLFRVPGMHLSLTNWKFVFAGLMAENDPPVLLIHMANEPPGWDVAYERLLAMDPTSGKVFGKVVTGGAMYLMGLTAQEVWLKTTFPKKSVNGYALPDLDLIYEQDALFAEHPDLEPIIKQIHIDGHRSDLCPDLRIEALDGYQYRLTPATGKIEKLPLDIAPPSPTLLDAWKRGCALAREGLLHDCRDCRPMQMDGDAVTIASGAGENSAHFVIGRRAPDGSMRWHVSDKQLFGPLDEDDPLRYIRYAALHQGRIILVCEDGRGLDDIYACAVNVEDGTIAWTRTFW